ncbi:MAG: hypothetical protein MR775_04780 [Erysipelotrichaceae bacterium]|nr:hypothetical protein [Erysipelotrichaceae bacterium]
MTSKEALYLLMTNQKKVRDDFRFIDLNTHEKVSIEECYDIIIKDLEVLEIIKKWSFIQKKLQTWIWNSCSISMQHSYARNERRL